MKFDVQSPIIPASNSPDKRVVALAWSPDSERLAVAVSGRYVQIININTNESSRIPVKGRDEDATKYFTITGIAWAPDSCRFAVTQSDNAVAVYEIGPASQPDARKRITVRFSHKSSVLCVGWPVTNSTEFIYGLADGAIHCGIAKMKKSEEIYRHTSAPPIRIATPMHQNAAVIGHADGTVYLVNLDTRNSIIVLQTTVSPLALAWGSQIVAAGSDLQINFVDDKTQQSSHVDLSNQKDIRSFTAASFDPSGSTAVVAGRNCLFTFTYSARLQTWQNQQKLEFDGLYSVPSLSWSPDGSRLAVSSVTGAVFMVTASIGSFRYKSLFEVTYVTGSQIKIKSLKANNPDLGMRSEYRILKTTFQQDRYAVVRTSQSFILGDTVSGKTCELPASPCDGEPQINERFIFIDDIAVLVWNTGELAVVEFGKNDTPASISTQYASPYLLSLRFANVSNINGGNGYDSQAKSGKKSKILAYLVDSKTIRVSDLERYMTLANVTIPNKIDWLELNVSGTMLLFRDSKHSLYVYNLVNQSLHGILNLCTYAQWVPEANVIVAQSKHQLYVWYSPTSPDEVRVTEIEGDVVDIVRSGTKTSVAISLNGKQTQYPLDGSFISFSAAMESKKLKDAAQILLEMNSSNSDNQLIDLKSLWAELGDAALKQNEYHIAELACSCEGDLSRARFLHKINKLISQKGENNCLVLSRIAMLNGNFKQAECILAEHDQLDVAVDMYKKMHMWPELIDLVRSKQGPVEAQKVTEQYFAHLRETGQFQEAAKLRASEGKIQEAVDLCLQGDKPQIAAELLLKNTDSSSAVNAQLLGHVAEELQKAQRYDVAGQVLERLGKTSEALDCYRRGHAFYNALELAQAGSPDQVMAIEKEWADYLASTDQVEASISHYVEAGEYTLAINSAIRAQQWNQAADILRSANSSPSLRDELKTLFFRVARHFANAGDANVAEDLYLSVGDNQSQKELIEMYLKLGKLDEAARRGKRSFKTQDYNALCIKVAKSLESKSNGNKTKLAEDIYISIKKPELAIEMHQRLGNKDDVARLRSQYGGDKGSLLETAQQAEAQGDLQNAESCYIRAGEWERALFMYKQEKKWEDALRVAKSNGKQVDEVQVAMQWVKDIGGAAGVAKLQSLNLVEPVLLYCCQNLILDLAYLIMGNAKSLSREALAGANRTLAENLESQSRFSEAEKHFIEAGLPDEAVQMYVHANKFQDAQRVAAKYGISNVPTSAPRSSANDTMNSSSKGSKGGLKRAMALEESRQYDDAITAYLALTPADCGSESRFDLVLDRAVKLCSNFNNERLPQVVTQVAQILIAANRHASLGKILEGISAYPDAFEIYKLGDMWDDAARLVQYLEPAEQQQFQQDYKKHLTAKEDVDTLLEKGNVDAALTILSTKGDWNRTLREAQKAGDQYVQKYTMKYAQYLVDRSQFDEAVSVLAKYSPSANVQNIPSYIELCKQTIYAVPSYETIQPSFFALRQMLFKILSSVSDKRSSEFIQLQNFTRAVHLLCQQATFEKLGLKDQQAKASLSLLRYANLLPSDFLFYKAGMIMKETGRIEAALAFFNRFIEIADKIKGDDSGIDNSLFRDSDVPTDLCFRKVLSVNDSVVESTNQWVLEQALGDHQPALPTMSCPKCGKLIFAGNLSCPSCRTKFEFDHATGSAIVIQTRCSSCGVAANRPDWSAFIAKTGHCPCCDAPQAAGA